MATVSIPSPSVIRSKSPRPPPSASVQLQPKKQVKPKGSPPSKPPNKPTVTAKVTQDGAVTKPKQSKSRNGCLTCKRKRLKCDETHPSCSQCAKRNVVCEGYKKDFKWRSFEEQSFNPRNNFKAKKNLRSLSFGTSSAQPRSIPNDGPSIESGIGPPASWSPGGLSEAFNTATVAFQEDPNLEGQGKTRSPVYNLPPYDSGTTELPEGLDPYSLPNTTRSSSRTNEDGSGHSTGSTFSSGSPGLADLLLPGTDLNKPPDPSELRPPMSPLPYSPAPFDSPPMFDGDMAMDEDFDEEIIRRPESEPATINPNDTRNWTFRQPSPALSDSSTSSKSSSMTLLAQPQLDASSPEMLMLRFDKSTCGILSVKDGPNENPWRTLIWPLARNSPALYHAISSMTAFHGAFEIRQLHVQGMAHMTKSIKKLASEIENMRLDSALATSLALAFGEGWDQHVSTGIQHLRGARVMVNNALVKHRKDVPLGQMSTQDAQRLKFLCNTFLYMDVIARLTSLEEAGNINFEEILNTMNYPTGDIVEVDPLMGCAVTLFPIIGRAANLIQRIRKVEDISLNMVSQARDLMIELKNWQTPSASMYERPEDVTSEIQHSISTADAYRYAMILYMHQAVPDLPSEPCEVLAKRILMAIAAVPLSSRAIIVQIFPLLAAGCEVTDPDDRFWVMERWRAMLLRLKIGNVHSCMSVTQEVWQRRDIFEDEKADRLARRFQAHNGTRGDFSPPMLKQGKRKAHSTEATSEEDFFGAMDFPDQDGRFPKAARRGTFDSMNFGMAPMGFMPLPSPVSSRREGDMVVSLLERDYTVRGRLHWLGVMEDWNWEVFLG